MPSRHRSRQRALQVLYQWDMTRQPVQRCIDSFYETLYSEESEHRPSRDEFMEELAAGAAGRHEELDRWITKHSEHWRLERMPTVDRNILRLAVHEMLLGATPPAVVIDEAIELARRFSGEESAPFVNGVLDAVNREIQGEPPLR